MIIFPTDAIDIFSVIPASATKYKVVDNSTPKTILAFVMYRYDKTQPSILYCGDTIVSRWPIGYDADQVLSLINCSLPISITNVSNATQYFQMVYTDYNLPTEPIPDINVNLSSQTLTLVGTPPNTFYVDNVWTNGELFIVFLLTFILMGGVLKFFWEFFYHKIVRIKTIQK
jgi:hypothetical protein